MTKGIISEAPLETFLTVSVRWHALFLLTTTASTFAARAVLNIEPTSVSYTHLTLPTTPYV